MSTTLAEFLWLPMDTQIVLVGALCAVSCALLGVFLVLRRMSMMGDAISHAVLPGLAGAFLITVWLQGCARSIHALPPWLSSLVDIDPRSGPIMMLGAALVGVLTALFTEWIHRATNVDEGASMGVVFTILFALGLILLRRAADGVDLDPDCVLNGEIARAPLDVVRIAGIETPRAALSLSAVLALNAAFVTLFYKELKISSFDPQLATTLGINAGAMHYALMVLVAITTVMSFESVGSILVIAMLIVPPATAHLLTDRLGTMIVVSAALAVACAVGGHLAAIVVPGMLGYPGVSTSTAGMMGVVSGALFFVVMLLAPRHGVLSRALRRAGLHVNIVREDIIALLYRIDERGLPSSHRPAAPSAIRRAIRAPRWSGWLALASLRSNRWVERRGTHYHLTALGRDRAAQIVRSHRLWETYLDRHIAVPSDHLHGPAEQLEHVTTPALLDELAESVENPPRDPHGSVIPPAASRTAAPTAPDPDASPRPTPRRDVPPDNRR
ncbi:MAG: hypothetical protein CHACPFDD_02196 [Phycisphaerae bacterium]|nr:hypothetical protein [Phycisphaerae bacterium]